MTLHSFHLFCKWSSVGMDWHAMSMRLCKVRHAQKPTRAGTKAGGGLLRKGCKAAGAAEAAAEGGGVGGSWRGRLPEARTEAAGLAEPGRSRLRERRLRKVGGSRSRLPKACVPGSICQRCRSRVLCDMSAPSHVFKKKLLHQGKREQAARQAGDQSGGHATHTECYTKLLRSRHNSMGVRLRGQHHQSRRRAAERRWEWRGSRRRSHHRQSRR